MTVFLLDLNVLLALFWPAHTHHKAAHRWFERHGHRGWATCPITQAGFVRILSNPSFSPDAPSLPEALAVLRENQSHPAHRFWADEIDFAEAVRPFGNRLLSHSRVTDAYLLSLAIHKRGKLATFDRSLPSLLAPGTAEKDAVELLRQEPN